MVIENFKDINTDLNKKRNSLKKITGKKKVLKKISRKKNSSKKKES